MPYLGRVVLDAKFLSGPYRFDVEGDEWAVQGADALEMGMLLRSPPSLFDEPDHHFLEWGDA